jgi:hypothetical protein
VSFEATGEGSEWLASDRMVLDGGASVGPALRGNGGVDSVRASS